MVCGCTQTHRRPMEDTSPPHCFSPCFPECEMISSELNQVNVEKQVSFWSQEPGISVPACGWLAQAAAPW